MIRFRDLTLAHGARKLFRGASLTLERGWKIGLVGSNGSGKSSLIAALSGGLAADAGGFELQAGMRLALIEQEAPALDQPVLDYLLDADDHLRAAELAIRDAEGDGDGEKIAAAHELFAHADGYTARARAQTLLSGLGFAPADGARTVGEFSGGYRMRLNLARALMRPSDLLLLDEPTNHLDLDTILWVEGWLRAYPGMMLVVSHDRDFLDRVTDHTLSIVNESLRLYTGNYSSYERQYATELEQLSALAARQEREVRRIVSFVERFRAKASKARQAQSRLKQLERMTRVATVYAADEYRFEFEEPDRDPERIVELEDCATGYGERAVIEGLSLAITRGDRIAVIGANGAGKTTFMRLLAGDLAPRAGERRSARDTRIGYFAQHEVENLREDETPFAMMARLYRGEREQSLRDYLGRFGFTGERAERPIGPLSGGEKSRLALASIVKRKPNLLLLDEPTNHLDLEMRRSLALALQSYTGALVIVSHDRHLLSACTDRVLVVEGGRVAEFDGDLDDYRQQKLRDTRENRGKSGGAKVNRREERRAEAGARADIKSKLRPAEKELAAIEARVAKLTRDADTLRATLANPAIYAESERDRLKAATLSNARIARELAEAEEDWLQAAARIEALRAD